MKFYLIVILLLFISCIQAQNCQFESKEQCISQTGCVWNKKTNQCEHHSIKNNHYSILDYILEFFFSIGRFILSIGTSILQFMERNIVRIILIFIALLFVAMLLALISHFEMKKYDGKNEKTFIFKSD